MTTAAPHPTFGQLLAAQRRERHLSTRALGREIGVSHTAIGLWEKDRTLPEAGTIPTLAHTLGVATSTVGRWLDHSPLAKRPAPARGVTGGCPAWASDLLNHIAGVPLEALAA